MRVNQRPLNMKSFRERETKANRMRGGYNTLLLLDFSSIYSFIFFFRL